MLVYLHPMFGQCLAKVARNSSCNGTRFGQSDCEVKLN